VLPPPHGGRVSVCSRGAGIFARIARSHLPGTQAEVDNHYRPPGRSTGPGTPDTPETRTDSKCSPRPVSPAVYWPLLATSHALFLTVLPLPEPAGFDENIQRPTSDNCCSCFWNPTSTHQAGQIKAFAATPHPNRRKRLFCAGGCSAPAPHSVSMLPATTAQTAAGYRLIAAGT